VAEESRTVAQLIEALKGCNPDAEVRIRVWSPTHEKGRIQVSGASTFRVMECNQHGHPTFIELDGRANGT
jgi:hypothetical protein